MQQSSKSFLSQAIADFNSKNYKSALDLFEKAGAVYGSHIVSANIELCRKLLSAALPSESARKGEPALDPATLLMLHNSGDAKIGAARLNKVLQQYRAAVATKSIDAKIKPVNPIPSDWPSELLLQPLPESTNDYRWMMQRKVGVKENKLAALSIVIPTYNRSAILDVTLACLVNQEGSYPFEVIVADDGSREQIVDVVKRYEDRLDIRYVRQKDYGYQLCAVRNLGLRTARYPFIAILDCDMAPNKNWVASYVNHLLENDDVALIGPRKYVDTSSYTGLDFLRNPDLIASLPEVITNNNEAGLLRRSVSVDWRLEHFKKTDNLRLCDSPFRYFSGGNVAFAKKWLDIAGWFDEEFTHWGGEDNEFAYRLYRSGCYFRAIDGGMAYHQEPPGKENETDRSEGKKITINIVRDKVPYFYRKIEDVTTAKLRAVPLVSIYVPAYNCAQHIVKCIESALNQTVVDLEVCVCDDGSTDDTWDVLSRYYGDHPRVRLMSKPNGGIGSASNAAVKMCRGYYIGQLDSDDYLEPDAVELCLKEFFKDPKLACVYTANRNVDNSGNQIEEGYNWPVFSREKLTTAMIVHHFRMFTARAWNLTTGFEEKMENAIDYDMYLKLSEIGPFRHVNKICYNRRLHGENTSIKKLAIQKKNHFVAVNKSLSRQGIGDFQYLPQSERDDSCRKYIFVKRG
ncbi:glycosyltransferase family 2 protein [Cupriavidus cauae]|uniref:Glycosyltransferase n=1 Tax=Cupriavidus cauae TaxID=2608999 RepID=A0A5M8BDC5_9BURK|nr:glycosyltransferase [Cupriavidus cauae]KAA6133383.1 glycosyltransferase [Cupriavidus cauae]